MSHQTISKCMDQACRKNSSVSITIEKLGNQKNVTDFLDMNHTMFKSISSHYANEVPAEKAAEAESDAKKPAADAIKVGSRVKVNFNGGWYDGTVQEVPEQNDKKQYKVHCDTDPANVMTYASKEGRDILRLHASTNLAAERTVSRTDLARTKALSLDQFSSEMKKDLPKTKSLNLVNRGRAVSATGPWRRDAEHHYEPRLVTVGDTLQIFFLLALGFLFLFFAVEGLVFCLYQSPRGHIEEPKDAN